MNFKTNSNKLNPNLTFINEVNEIPNFIKPPNYNEFVTSIIEERSRKSKEPVSRGLYLLCLKGAALDSKEWLHRKALNITEGICILNSLVIVLIEKSLIFP